MGIGYCWAIFLAFPVPLLVGSPLQTVGAESVSPTLEAPGQAKMVPVEKALGILEALERRYRTARFTAKSEPVVIENPSEPFRARAKSPDHYQYEEVAVDYERQLYVIHCRGFTPSRSPEDKRPIERCGFIAFDGKEHRALRCMDPRTAVAERGPPVSTWSQLGCISHNWEPGSWLDDTAFSFPPNQVSTTSVKGKPLSQWIRDKRDTGELVGIEESAPGIWTIRWKDTYTPSSGRTYERIVVTTCDVNRGGLVLEQVDYLEDGRLWGPRIVYTLEQQGEFWFPKIMVRFSAPQLKGPVIGSRREYSNVRINEPIPDEVFRPEFPKGTRVRDYIRKVSYIVGEPFDEAQAIRRFMQEHGLAAPPETPKRWPWWLWATGLGLLMLVLAALLAWRWRWLRSYLLRSSAVLLLGAGLCLTGFGQPPRQQASSAPAPPATKPPGTLSCGYRAAVFCLEYFGRQYRPYIVDALLPITEKGVRLSDLQTALEAHGLDTVARKQVSLAELEQTLRPEVLAIVPVQVTSGQMHYVVAVFHPQHGALLADPPFGLMSLRQLLGDRQEMEPSGVVLFVQRANLTKPMERLVEVEPAVVDFGTVREEEQQAVKPLTRKLTVRNRADRPLAMWFSLECGLSTSEGHRLLGAGETWETEVKLLRCGHTQSTVLVELPDGSKKRVRVLARSADRLATPKPWPELRPDNIRLQVPLTARAGDALTAVALYEARLALPEEPRLTGLPDWTEVTIEPATERARFLRVRVRLEEGLLTELRQLGNKTGEFRVTCGDWPVVNGKISLLRPRPVEVNPTAIMLTAAQPSASIRIKPALPEVQIKEIRFLHKPAALTISGMRSQPDGWDIGIVWNGQLDNSVVALSGEAICEPSGPEPVAVVVQLRP